MYIRLKFRYKYADMLCFEVQLFFYAKFSSQAFVSKMIFMLNLELDILNAISLAESIFLVASISKLLCLNPYNLGDILAENGYC